MTTQTPIYSNDMKIEDALQVYFKKYHFADGGYHDKYFRIKLGPLFLPFPNTKSRVIAVKFHDIHHLLTDYSALWKGEIEIGAWEIASGCGNHYVAWTLNFGSFTVGLFLYPAVLFKAFMAGKRVRTNLYHGYTYDERLLNRTIGALRRELDIHAQKKNKLLDYLSFLFWMLLVLMMISLAFRLLSSLSVLIR